MSLTTQTPSVQITPIQALTNLAAIAANALLNRQDRAITEASIEVLAGLINAQNAPQQAPAPSQPAEGKGKK